MNRRLIPLILLAGWAASPAAWAQGVGRQQLTGYRTFPASQALSAAGLSAPETLDLSFSLPLRHPDEIEPLLERLYDPADPLYRHFLTMAQFTGRFGPSPADYQSVVAFAQAHHLELTGTYPNRLLVDARGSLADVEAAFHVKLLRFRRPDGSLFHAPDRQPSVDLDTPLGYVGGLENFQLAHPAGLRHLRPA
ncbi:MAG TPA: protease pro-enzyme activation domain-containing protein, partial [bacterium]|nr:protease pro-enzyme activation domain-containing protein [bacterium]